jgi:hypothetical protein
MVWLTRLAATPEYQTNIVLLPTTQPGHLLGAVTVSLRIMVVELLFVAMVPNMSS